MFKIEIPLSDLARVYQPGGLFLLSTGTAAADSCVVPVAWHTRMLEQPEQIACVLQDDCMALHSLQLAGSCVLNLPTDGQLEDILRSGGMSGLHAAQSARHWNPQPSHSVAACSIEHSLAHIECRLSHIEPIGRFTLCLLEPVLIRADAGWHASLEAHVQAPAPHSVRIHGHDLASSAHLLQATALY